VTAILGDLTFYHDLNGLLALRRESLPLTIVLINNNGGGIFQRLPIADFEPPFTDLFVTPHGLDFAAAAQLYGLRHVVAGEREAFLTAFAAAQADPEPWLIEVPTMAAADERLRQQLVAAVHETTRRR
jgi:2-succinyl-5-enolpyruvyl-6-hydroxy-3-cyclohexene-1-carboxylate synthase